MKLPRYIASTPAQGTGLARANDIGALTRTGGAEFEALKGAGRATQGTADTMFQVQQHKQKISDDTQTDRISQNIRIWANEWEAGVETTRVETPDDQKRIMKSQKKSFNEMIAKETKGMSSGVQRNIKALSTQMFPTIQNRARRLSTAKILDYTVTTRSGMSQAKASAGDLEGANADVDKMYAEGIIVESERVKLIDENIESNIVSLYRKGTYSEVDKDGKLVEKNGHDEARKALEESSLDSTQKERLDDIIDTDERVVQVEANADLKNKQNETSLNLLTSLWDGKLTDEMLRQATDSGMITFERAKGLRETLTNPSTFDLPSYIKVKNAVNSYERGKISFDVALDTLTQNASMLGDQGKGLTDKIFAMPNKNEADWEGEGIDYIQSQILEKDIFGRFYGTPKEQTAALEARLAYDVAIETAERKGQPVEGRDKLILAHDIMLKYRPEKKTKPPIELDKGLGSVPFINENDIDKAIIRAKESLGEKATPQDIKEEALRLLR